MSRHNTLDTERRIPTRREAAVFRFKSFLLQLNRLRGDLRSGQSTKFGTKRDLADHPIIAESRTPLWTENSAEERELVAGKIQNIRVALRRINGITVDAGKVFSFWKQVGRTSRFRGFVKGRELREGCIIPNIGGGLCQLSNALYDAALKANFEIIERHAHTRVIAGSLAEQSRDATVFWNYVDLRFRAAVPYRIEAKLESGDLVVKFRSEHSPTRILFQIGRSQTKSAPNLNSCMSCEADCHRVERRFEKAAFGRTAFLVDDVWPEFDRYIQSVRTLEDRIFIPLDGNRFRKANYRWTTAGFSAVKQSIFLTARRSVSSRRLAVQGAARQLNLLEANEKLAESYGRRLSYADLHVVVQQNLLPFLWRAGHLGGRTFDVLMTAMPMSQIQDRLDFAHSLHPESRTLADFRADDLMVQAEFEALAHARSIITPHSAIAAHFGDRAVTLDWQRPLAEKRLSAKNHKPQIVLPSATVGRKGCYELREALRGLDVSVVTLGPIIEHTDFWSGFDTRPGGSDWLENADLVALPAFVEHRPRRLLQAAAAGIRVIATPETGVCGVNGIEMVEAGNVQQLRDAILSHPPGVK